MTPWLLPATGALIGWFTNKLALALLFRPRSPVQIGPWRLQGIIPARHQRLAEAIARTVQRDLLSEAQIARLVAEIDLRDEIEKAVATAIDQRIDASRLHGLPLVGKVGGRFFTELRRVIMTGVAKRVQDYQQRVAHQVASRVDIETIVRDRVEHMDVGQVEELLLGILRDEFRYLEWMGAVIGGVIGTGQLFFLDR
jgi:uncharacterized membrane protein YheB (UPF0754 family)